MMEIGNDKEWKEVLDRNPSMKKIFDELDKIIEDMESDLSFIKEQAKIKGIKPEMI